MKLRYDLKFAQNYNCTTSCNNIQRKKVTENDLCTIVNSVADSLPVRCVGEWAIEKIYLLYQYFGIFTFGMKNKWPNAINYIEICSGPGRCIQRKSGKEFNGTALSIIDHKAFNYLNKAIFFDFNQSVVDSLNTRILNRNINKAKAFVGDYNKPNIICDIISKEINCKSLTLVFIDPTDCSVPFKLIRNINYTINKVDFIINLASGTDFNRNIKNAIQRNQQKTISKYSKFLGSIDYFRDIKNISASEQGNHTFLRNSFREYYKNSMKDIGYNHFDFTRIKNYYDILFASKDPKGIEFWKKATSTTFNGQKEIPF